MNDVMLVFIGLCIFFGNNLRIPFLFLVVSFIITNFS